VGRSNVSVMFRLSKMNDWQFKHFEAVGDRMMVVENKNAMLG